MDKYIFYEICSKLSLGDLYNLFLISKNSNLGVDQDFWIYKLQKDYPDTYNFYFSQYLENRDWNKLYKYIYIKTKYLPTNYELNEAKTYYKKKYPQIKNINDSAFILLLDLLSDEYIKQYVFFDYESILKINKNINRIMTFDPKINPQSREDFIEEFMGNRTKIPLRRYEIINSNPDESFLPKHKIDFLFRGIFYDNNWIYLSDNDITLLGYINNIDTFDHLMTWSRQEIITKIIENQNKLLYELLNNNIVIEPKKGDIVTTLLIMK